MELHEVFKKIAIDQQNLEMAQGVVTATTTGSVSVKINGSTTAISGIKYLSSYTPAINDVVFMLIDGKDVLILGKRG